MIDATDTTGGLEDRIAELETELAEVTEERDKWRSVVDKHVKLSRGAAALLRSILEPVDIPVDEPA